MMSQREKLVDSHCLGFAYEKLFIRRACKPYILDNTNREHKPVREPIALYKTAPIHLNEAGVDFTNSTNLLNELDHQRPNHEFMSFSNATKILHENK
ncbi:hypothetical protein [Granulicatella balaenopterae]|nr:hypothetical protein [Granulicatella balaenopterae]